ncbi:MAG TPA: transglutaminase-like domain-containing protein [Trebonia sp.]|nr:transglutaminase-like domain-containing protein [Trebonia sp.]
MNPDGPGPGPGGRTSLAGLSSLNPDGDHGITGTVSALRRRVCGQLALDVQEPLTMILRLAVSEMPGVELDERLGISHDGKPLQATETVVVGEGRSHLLQVRPGRVIVTYEATVTGQAPQSPVTPADRLIYLRPSRYAESDRLTAVARGEFAGISAEADLLAAVSSWVGRRLGQLPGSGQPADGAVDTLLAGRGVCRDHAHLVIALLRALGVPARMVAAYAPGLDPMDFHAVAEAAVDGYWRVADSTSLAPRATLVRIACGRDAADTAFLSVYGGVADLLETSVTATVDGTLPDDDTSALASIA